MKTALKLSVSTLALSLLTSISMQASADSRYLYVIGGMGVGFLEDAKFENDGSVEDGTDLALRAGVGYQFDRYFGAELDYFYYVPVEGESNGVDINTEVQSLALVGVFKYPIQNFSIFGKVGPSYNWKTLEIQYADDHMDEEWGIAYGGGLEYFFSERIGGQVEYMVTDDDASAATANIVVRFF